MKIMRYGRVKLTLHSTRGQGTQCCAQSHPGQCLQVTSMANRLTRATGAMMTRAVGGHGDQGRTPVRMQSDAQLYKKKEIIHVV